MRINPFPRVAIPRPRDGERILFDPDGVSEKILGYIENVYREDSKGSVIIVGNYGHGKTHLLLFLKSALKEQFDKQICLYLPTPGTRFRDLYREIISALMSEVELETLSCEAPYDLCKALKLLKEESNEAMNWLLGEHVPTHFRRKQGLRNNRHETSMLQTIQELLETLKINGFKPIVILLDELETLLSYTSMVRLQYLNGLRHLIDVLPSSSVLVAATTPAGWMEIINTHPALARRLSSMTVYLRNFTEEELRALIDLYLSRAGLRIDQVFGSDVIERLYDLSEGNAGEALKLASILFDIYVSNGHRLTLDDSWVVRVLSNYV